MASGIVQTARGAAPSEAWEGQGERTERWQCHQSMQLGAWSCPEGPNRSLGLPRAAVLSTPFQVKLRQLLTRAARREGGSHLQGLCGSRWTALGAQDAPETLPRVLMCRMLACPRERGQHARASVCPTTLQALARPDARIAQGRFFSVPALPPFAPPLPATAPSLPPPLPACRCLQPSARRAIASLSWHTAMHTAQGTNPEAAPPCCAALTAAQLLPSWSPAGCRWPLVRRVGSSQPAEPQAAMQSTREAWGATVAAWAAW